ncbi:MAG: hypothetical protein OHK0017_12060 [Patescibacteria group bacterium]
MVEKFQPGPPAEVVFTMNNLEEIFGVRPKLFKDYVGLTFSYNNETYKVTRIGIDFSAQGGQCVLTLDKTMLNGENNLYVSIRGGQISSFSWANFEEADAATIPRSDITSATL